MNEIDRLIQNRTCFNASFFLPETICGFYVDEDRKKIWAVEIDALLELDALCKKNGLTYFLFYGSLLGAVRHNGFIPWDDDIDVAMPRKDYDILCSLGEKGGILRDPYMLQTPYTDAGYYYSIAKLRNSNTTAVSVGYRWEKFNQGMGIDIFPLDNCIPDEMETCYQKIKSLCIDNSNYMRSSIPPMYRTENDELRIKSHSGRDPLDVCQEIEDIATAYKNINTGYITVAVFTKYHYSRQIFRTSDFSEQELCDFRVGEHLFQFPIPVGYDEILSTLYGNYMEFPKIEERGTWHNGKIFDPNVPYTEYLL